MCLINFNSGCGNHGDYKTRDGDYLKKMYLRKKIRFKYQGLSSEPMLGEV